MKRHKRVLIVDDDRGALFVLRSALQELAHLDQVHVASSGDEALAQMQVSPYDLVVTDLLMPGLSGQQLTAAILCAYPDTVVIWITAHRSQETDEEARQLGVSICLDKPIHVAQFRRTVSRALRNG